MVKTLCFHHWGRGFDLWSGNKDPMYHASWPKNFWFSNSACSLVLHGSASLEWGVGGKKGRTN